MSEILPESPKKPHKLLLLSLAALGVVYGDIGTSPLYAINEIFFGHRQSHITRTDILGGISLVLWSLTLLISIKYVILVLQADNQGEGGVFALYGLLNQISTRTKIILSSLLIIAAGLLFGDGIITPAISVISAVEGLSIATSALTPFIVPATIIILTGLFLIQSKGTSKVGTIFGPIVVIWFLSIGLLGLSQILPHPAILQAVNPLYAFKFLLSHDLYTTMLTLGSVMLVITGGEAMYADMGHFGRLPIRLSWFSIVYPALMLNYLGQGAYLLSGQPVLQGNIFYSLVPSMLLLPMVMLATLATIIASQALISGAFSLAAQAISLGLLPYLKITHTHHEHEGQIYVPFINWALYIGCVLLVLVFQSSDKLASAYGLAVSGVMLVTTLSMIQIAKHFWHWRPWVSYLLFLPFVLIDAIFLSANSLKIVEGGYIPLLIGLGLLVVMQTWQWGRAKILAAFAQYPAMTLSKLLQLRDQAKVFLPKSMIIMTPDPVFDPGQKVPILKQMFWERYGAFPKHSIFLTVAVAKVPHLKKDRFEIRKLYQHPTKGTVVSVRANFGFMEEIDVEKVLADLARQHTLEIDEHHKHWLVHVMHERVQLGKTKDLFDLIRYHLFKFLQRNTETADQYFGLGREKYLSIEVLPVTIP